MTREELDRIKKRIMSAHEERRLDFLLITVVCGLIHNLERIMDVVDEQAKNEGLWFNTTSITEAYLQQSLRKLHEVIES